MKGDKLALGVVAVLATAGSVRKRGSGNPDSSSLSTSLDLPTLPRSPGPGFYRKGRSVVVVGAPMGRDHGNDPPLKLHSWRGKPRPESFTSPMVRWDNMHFMGGYSWRPHHWDGATYDGYRTDEAIVDAVIAGKKPAATVGRISGGYGADPQADMRKAKELHAKAKAAGLYVSPLHTTHPKLGRWLSFTIAQPGTVGDHFDLDAWADTWGKYGWDLRPPVWDVSIYPRSREASLFELANWAKDMKLSDLINRFHVNEDSIPGPIRGLLLGYPIFSTVSVWK
ncbi:hypothetical protein CMI47_01260 [Candidatus Pacearchaeota archaeon]|nr:hypothetical protein [Candidatus Pacearchaeota archaeon]